MRRRTGHALLLLLSLGCVLPLSAQDSDVSGTVRDSAGHALAGVWVVGINHFPAGGSEDVKAETDDLGHFELKRVGRVLFFGSPKFRALTYVRDRQQATVDVSLKPETEHKGLSTCSLAKESGTRYGSWMLFLVPRHTKLRHHYGTDSRDLEIYFPHTRTSELMMLWSGQVGTAFVPEETILSASTFAQNGFDWRGKDNTGKNWRWLSTPRDLIHYENASNAAATFFDSIIDSACVRNYEAKK